MPLQARHVMKIKKVTFTSSAWIEFENDDTIYLRLSADNWMYRVGESLEAQYDCSSLENAYQATRFSLNSNA